MKGVLNVSLTISALLFFAVAILWPVSYYRTPSVVVTRHRKYAIGVNLGCFEVNWSTLYVEGVTPHVFNPLISEDLSPPVEGSFSTSVLWSVTASEPRRFPRFDAFSASIQRARLGTLVGRLNLAHDTDATSYHAIGAPLLVGALAILPTLKFANVYYLRRRRCRTLQR